LAGKVRTAENATRRSNHQRRNEYLHYGEESVSVAFEEISAQDWAEKVYKPEILNNADKLYKKPGYTM